MPDNLAPGTASVKIENFTFDALNRLETTQVDGQALQSFGYADNGNITSKTGVGDYSYHATRRHAVERVTRGVISHEYAYDANGRMTTEHAVQDGEADRLVREIQYTSFSQPALITHHASPKLATDRPLLGGVEGLCQMAFYYGSDLQRLMQVKVKGATTTRTLYMGAYEVREVLEGSTTLLEREERSSFGSGAQVRLYTLGSGVTSVAMEFTLKDHLGSTSAGTFCKVSAPAPEPFAKCLSLYARSAEPFAKCLSLYARSASTSATRNPQP